MTRPAFVTFTGLDAFVDLDRAAALSARYPVEWGVLFSPRLQGEGRYPPLDAARRILARPLRLAAHICGGHAREIVETGDCPSIAPLLAGRVGRIQVNTSAEGVDAGRVAAFARTLGDGTRAILQSRDPSGFPPDEAVDWLCDRSAGNGVLPDSWPRPVPGRFVGYAGGLGPDTVGAALDAILRGHPEGTPYWIDMETRIRDAQDRIDLDLCEAVLRSVYPDA